MNEDLCEHINTGEAALQTTKATVVFFIKWNHFTFLLDIIFPSSRRTMRSDKLLYSSS